MRMFFPSEAFTSWKQLATPHETASKSPLGLQEAVLEVAFIYPHFVTYKFHSGLIFLGGIILRVFIF